MPVDKSIRGRANILGRYRAPDDPELVEAAGRVQERLDLAVKAGLLRRVVAGKPGLTAEYAAALSDEGRRNWSPLLRRCLPTTMGSATRLTRRPPTYLRREVTRTRRRS